MDTWTLQMGYPLITVRRNYDARTARVSQERFLVGKSKEVSLVFLSNLKLYYLLITFSEL